MGELKQHDLVGRGWHFPVRFDVPSPDTGSIPARGRGGIAFAHGELDIEQAIFIVLSTIPGERRMRPTFGCRVHELLFAPINPTTLGLMEQYAFEALQMWEPRVDVIDIRLTPFFDDARIDIEVRYTIRLTKDERTLVYPFYTIREEAHDRIR
jgi:phage baseplate assembly protein W